ncbi:MAG: hypothetical protein KAR42_05105 [candidate division Zixibacteria bacterium]|nr:hypothetical protein [candidate division Zixibacteria bacterium]
MAWLLSLIILVGISSGGTSCILCIGDDGHVEFETICLPACGDTNDFCALEVVDEVPHEHSDCSNCSDVELDGSLWLKPIQKNDPNQLILFASTLTIDGAICPLSWGNNNSQITKCYLEYGQSPPSCSIATTIIRC